MIQQPQDNRSLDERFEDREGMDRAVRNAVRDALRRHMLLGESVAVAGENGGAKILRPDEIRKALESW